MPMRILVVDDDEETRELVGHALEVRIYAEDPAGGFLPQSGPVHDWHLPAMEGLRVDGGVASGDVVGIHYDPMMAKIITHGADREQSVRRMQRALESLSVQGLATNRDFLLQLLAHVLQPARAVLDQLLQRPMLHIHVQQKAFGAGGAITVQFLCVQKHCMSALAEVGQPLGLRREFCARAARLSQGPRQPAMGLQQIEVQAGMGRQQFRQRCAQRNQVTLQFRRPERGM